MTVGIDLATYGPVLTRVPDEHTLKPVRAFDAIERFGPHVKAYMEHYWESTDLVEKGHGLPIKAYARLTADEIAKTMVSFRYAMDSAIRDELNKDPIVGLVQKIKSSMWRWSWTEMSWNDMVDAYDGIRSFDIGVPGFTATFDHTSWHNEKGRGVESGVFLDGVFAFLVHWRGEHVMTIGFSIASGHRLLLQQVQMTKRTGNRWLFKFPGNRMELVVDRLKSAFPTHEILVVDGGAIAQKNLDEYLESRKTEKRRLSEHLERQKRTPDNGDLARYIAENRSNIVRLGEKISHLEADKPRLAAFYADLGRHRLTGQDFESNGLKHRAIAA